MALIRIFDNPQDLNVIKTLYTRKHLEAFLKSNPDTSPLCVCINDMILYSFDELDLFI